jgi:uncharacterized protein YciI
MADHEKMLGKNYYVIITTAAVDPTSQEYKDTLPAHLDHQVQLEKDGIMFAAGPMDSEDGGRRGLIIIRAGSYDEARKIADRDPYHAKGLRKYTVEKWTVNEGTYSVRVTYSDQRMAIE